MPFSRPICSVTNCPSTTFDVVLGQMWFGLDFRWVSALAYSTDRAGCVSHPTPTRRCTHVEPGGRLSIGNLCASLLGRSPCCGSVWLMTQELWSTLHPPVGGHPACSPQSITFPTAARRLIALHLR